MSIAIPSFFKYPIISDRDKDWQLYCTVVGCSEVPPNSPYPLEKHPQEYNSILQGRILHEFQLIYITHGKGIYESDQIEIVINPGTMILLFPGVRHLYHPIQEDGWDEYYVGFRGPYAETLQDQNFIDPQNPLFEIGFDDLILQQFLYIFDLIQNEPPLYQQQISASTLQILTRTLSLSKQKKHGSEKIEMVEKVKYQFEENIYHDLEMEEFAKEFGITYPKLRAIFKEITHLSPYNYFLQLKINKAKVLLHQSDMSVKEIAFKLAFQNEYYFSRLFKKKTKMSPSGWRSSSYFSTDLKSH